MSKITDASATNILLVQETEYGVMPALLTGLELGITGEGLAPNIESVQSEELNTNPDVMDTILSGVDAGGDLNYEVSEGAGMRKILEHALRGTWQSVGTPAVNTLKASSEEKSMTILKTFRSVNGDFPFAYTGARLNSLSFDITAGGGIITSTANFMAKSEKFLGEFGFFQQPNAGYDNPFYGYTGDLMITNTGYLMMRTTSGWEFVKNPDTGLNFKIMTVDIISEIKAQSALPSGVPAKANELVLRTSNGQWYWTTATAYLPIVGMVTMPKATGGTLTSPAIWRSGTALPSDGSGNFGDYYIVTGVPNYTPGNAGKIFQKMSREVDAPWTQVADISGYNSFKGSYYWAMNPVPKSYKTKMHIPQFKNVIVTGQGATGKYCFTDLGFTIENNCENVKGICTKNTEYPWLSAVETKYGARSITGNATILFNSVELYEDFFKKNKVMSIKFSMENGEGQAWDFHFPKVKFSEGSINAGGKGENIEIPLKWMALYDPDYGTSMIVEEYPIGKTAPIPAPINYGASGIWSDAIEANFSFVETADNYEYELALDSEFADVVGNGSTADNTQLSAYVDGLDPVTEYYFRVRSVVGGSEYSDWSTVEKITTTVTIPTFLDISDLTLSYLIRWNPVTEAGSYRLDVAFDPNFEDIYGSYSDFELLEPQKTIAKPPPQIPPQNLYHRIRAVVQYPDVVSESSEVVIFLND